MLLFIAHIENVFLENLSPAAKKCNKTNERVAAYKEFVNDTENKKFDDPKITVSIDDREYDQFLKLSDKI